MAREAEKILDMLEDEEQKRREQHRDYDDDEGGEAAIVPSLTIYNTVLNAWANSRRRDAPARAEALLERMRILSSTGRNPGIEPDSISVSTVISCHARSRTRRGAERGERMLDDAIDMYSKGNSRVKPDSIMFNCAITGEKRGDFRRFLMILGRVLGFAFCDIHRIPTPEFSSSTASRLDEYQRRRGRAGGGFAPQPARRTSRGAAT
jgi:DNA-binding transcriptional regulator YdaS (Cro superfamily)